MTWLETHLPSISLNVTMRRISLDVYVWRFMGLGLTVSLAEWDFSLGKKRPCCPVYDVNLGILHLWIGDERHPPSGS